MPPALPDAYARHGGDDRVTVEVLALIAGCPVEEVEQALSDPARVAELEAHRAKLEAEGALRPERVARALDKVVGAIERELAKDGTDGFAAVELAKPLLRMAENFERIRLAERDGHENLPMIHIVFENGGIEARPVRDGDELEVIDIEASVPPRAGEGAA